VDLNYSVINDLCNKIKLGKKGYIFILDKDGGIVYHPQQQLIYSSLKSEMIDQVMSSKTSNFTTSEGKNSRMYTINQSKNPGWKIVGVAYVDELVSNKREIQTYIFLWGMGFVLVAIIISVILSLRISRPIKRLEVSMKEVERGNFDIQMDIESTNEIGQLSKRFNRMTTEIKELMLQNITEQELKRKSELKALQAQINPHFFYNTLDSIIWMAESKKSEEVVLMVAALARLFRISISKGQEMITIANEIEHIKSYLTIQKMRYKDKLGFEIDVDPIILQKKMLKIILQPLVENSIYHGIKNNTGVGIIRIKGKIVEDRILLQVIDNGIGMTAESVQRMFEKTNKPESISGIGVNNVNQRIQIYFGTQYGITYESELGEGTTANIWLPILE
jgi:two-component system sensor histidine kinase YesM